MKNSAAQTAAMPPASFATRSGTTKSGSVPNVNPICAAMVDAAERVITVYDGGAAGGTAAAVRYAQRRGRELVRLWY